MGAFSRSPDPAWGSRSGLPGHVTQGEQAELYQVLHLLWAQEPPAGSVGNSQVTLATAAAAAMTQQFWFRYVHPTLSPSPEALSACPASQPVSTGPGPPAGGGAGLQHPSTPSCKPLTEAENVDTSPEMGASCSAAPWYPQATMHRNLLLPSPWPQLPASDSWNRKGWALSRTETNVQPEVTCASAIQWLSAQAPMSTPCRLGSENAPHQGSGATERPA